MSLETQVLLKTILYQAKRAKNAQEIIHAIEAMCDEETIAFIEKKVKETNQNAN